MMNEATWGKSGSKEEKFNQLWQGIKELKETTSFHESQYEQTCEH